MIQEKNGMAQNMAAFFRTTKVVIFSATPVLTEDTCWAELLRGFGTQIPAEIKYVAGITSIKSKTGNCSLIKQPAFLQLNHKLHPASSDYSVDRVISHSLQQIHEGRNVHRSGINSTLLKTWRAYNGFQICTRCGNKVISIP